MPDTPVCWKCGASLAQLSLPLLRLDTCKQCGTELHVCKMCRFYDVTVAKHCREPIADEVRDKQRANFCGYFELNYHAFKGVAVTTNTALDELFCSKSATTPTTTDAAREALEKLFGK